MGCSEVNSQVSWTGYEKTRPVEIRCQYTQRVELAQAVGHTSNDLRALKVFVRMKIARAQRKVDAHQEQQEVRSPPHVAGL
jgi:hypothetical protein